MTHSGQQIRLQKAHYTLLAPLGSSSYGVVWRAWGQGRAVALKLINQAQMRQAASAQRHAWIASAEQEIQFLQQLSPWDQRHIACMLDHGSHDSLPAFALELLGTDLQTHLRQQRVALPQALQWLAHINQALAKVHSFGYCYLDLKPANVLLSKDASRVKLVDFGSNKVHQSAQIGYRGTPNWQAPEQFFPSQMHSDGWQYSSDYRSDYFALGAMLYFLVCGGVPLRFCSLCGQAFRQYGVWGAQKIAPQPTLYADEEALFIACATSTQAESGTACGSVPAASTAQQQAAQEALRLLRSLLAQDPAARPQSSLDIAAALQCIAKWLA